MKLLGRPLQFSLGSAVLLTLFLGSLGLLYVNNSTWRISKSIDIPYALHDNSISLSADGNVMALNAVVPLIESGRALVFDLKRGVLLQDFPFKQMLNSLSISPNGEIVGGIRGQPILEQWNVQTGERLPPMPLNISCYGAYEAQFSPDENSIVAVGYNGFLNRFDRAGKWLAASMPEDFRALRFSPDGKLLIAQRNRSVCVVDSLSLQTIVAGTRSCEASCAAILPANNLVAILSLQNLSVFTLPDKKLKTEILLNELSIYPTLACSPSGEQLLVADLRELKHLDPPQRFGRVRIFDSRTGALQHTFERPLASAVLRTDCYNAAFTSEFSIVDIDTNRPNNKTVLWTFPIKDHPPRCPEIWLAAFLGTCLLWRFARWARPIRAASVSERSPGTPALIMSSNSPVSAP